MIQINPFLNLLISTLEMEETRQPKTFLGDNSSEDGNLNSYHRRKSPKLILLLFIIHEAVSLAVLSNVASKLDSTGHFRPTATNIF
jgi:hypothetical protein